MTATGPMGALVTSAGDVGEQQQKDLLGQLAGGRMGRFAVSQGCAAQHEFCCIRARRGMSQWPQAARLHAADYYACSFVQQLTSCRSSIGALTGRRRSTWMLPEPLARRGDARPDLTGPVATQADRVVWLAASAAVVYVPDPV